MGGFPRHLSIICSNCSRGGSMVYYNIFLIIMVFVYLLVIELFLVCYSVFFN